MTPAGNSDGRGVSRLSGVLFDDDRPDHAFMQCAQVYVPGFENRTVNVGDGWLGAAWRKPEFRLPLSQSAALPPGRGSPD
jgi:hypothetical protein